MDLVLASEILPNYKQQREAYGIDRCDLHPNARANEQIAEFIAARIKSGSIKAKSGF
ncbi:hypothetical protein [Helicobacter zhangjianzhongii]|nr:hypothetical protein [Helicobacter sp. CPD2-1]MDL0079061.1 hypothetical protein [Helicobacter sp. CPD2-1]